MSNGMVSKNLNPTTNYFFFENLARLALQIKKDNSTDKNKFVREIKDLDQILKPQGVKTYNRKRKRANVILNPLNVPDELLKANGKSSV
ncbi:hypothetical protein MTP99_013818 [Tenebrio molitor]|nr:hypothetical protein MTP99_013818 [Tenebrio molitor]